MGKNIQINKEIGVFCVLLVLAIACVVYLTYRASLFDVYYDRNTPEIERSADKS